MMHRAAVPVLQHGKHWEAGGEILMNLRGAPDLMWAAFRRLSNPVVWSIWLSVRIMPPICVPRSTPALFNSGYGQSAG
ncbi:hypothetical protein J4730_07910 [Klebsiella pneumoniae]|uniref:Uncharacterized protein n=1 Tax=Klebsiella pneumoniae TaxID=573 RepID=A0A939NK41_KLEPN|nr:hypothetical protein [Klebsiella pneumoniae]